MHPSTHNHTHLNIFHATCHWFNIQILSYQYRDSMVIRLCYIFILNQLPAVVLYRRAGFSPTPPLYSGTCLKEHLFSVVLNVRWSLMTGKIKLISNDLACNSRQCVCLREISLLSKMGFHCIMVKFKTWIIIIVYILGAARVSLSAFHACSVCLDPSAIPTLAYDSSS